MTAITTAVVPAAGLGTRLLPATLAVPKELLPVGGRPAVEWVIDEAIGAGIERLVVVSSVQKPAISAYLVERDRCASSGDGGRSQVAVRPIEWSVVHQERPAGLGDAVRVARDAVGDEPFAILLPDELFLGGARLLAAMVAAFSVGGQSQVALMPVERDEISSYGAADFGRGTDGALVVRGCVEKPHPDEAPSFHAVAGRYVVGREVLDELDDLAPGARGEIQLTDALHRAATGAPLGGAEVLDEDERVDVGNWRGWLEANVRLLGERVLAR